jgi:two-component system sensor histidine kinase KdpD
MVFSLLGLLLLPISSWLANENIIMLYLLMIIIVNHGRGKLSATIAALIATISFDFFFIPPRFSFAIGDFQYIITFIVMAIVGVAFSIVTGNLRFQVSALRKAQNKSKLLYESSKRLAEAMIDEQIFEVVKEFLPKLFAAKYALFIPNSDEALHIQENTLEQAVDMSITHWVFAHGQNAGLNTNTFAASSIYYIPINSQIRTRGVMAFVPDSIFDFFLPEQQELLANFASSLATTLERIHFTQIAIETEVFLAQQRSTTPH